MYVTVAAPALELLDKELELRDEELVVVVVVVVLFRAIS